MRRVSDHLSAVLGTVDALAPIDVGLLDAHGTVAAEDVIAPWALPQYDHATVPGYALRAADSAKASLPRMGASSKSMRSPSAW